MAVSPSRHVVGICASGPSLTPADVRTLRALVGQLIVINTTFRLALDADHLYACDKKWWDVYHAEVAMDFGGACWTYDRQAATDYGLHHLPGDCQGRGLCRQPMRIHTGGNSGFQAINLAYHLGATRIILLGYDMQGSTHWHGAHPAGLNNGHSHYADWRARLGELAKDLEAEGVEVINATRDTALTCFRRVALEDL